MVNSVTMSTPQSSATIRRNRSASEVEPPAPGDKARIPMGFGEDNEFLESLELARIGTSLMDEFQELRHCRDLTIRYLWKKKGGLKGGKATLGKCNKVSGLAEYFGECDFVIWLAADNCSELRFTNHQVRALVYHELKHIGIEYDEKTDEPTYRVLPHDLEIFYDEVRRFGLWEADLEHADSVFAQLRLPQPDGAK